MDLVKYQFNDKTLYVSKYAKGFAVTLRSVSDAVGLAYSSFTQRLKRNYWAKSTMFITNMVAEDGKTRDMLMIDIRKLPMILATIDANRCKPEIRAKIELYQNEAAEALADHFLGKRGADTEQIAHIKEANRLLEAQNRFLAKTNAEMARSLLAKPNSYLLCKQNAIQLRGAIQEIAALRAELKHPRAERNCVENDVRYICRYYRTPGACWEACPDHTAEHAISWCQKALGYLKAEKKRKEKAGVKYRGQVVIDFPGVIKNNS